MSLVEQLAEMVQSGPSLSDTFQDALTLQRELISRGIVKKQEYDLPQPDVTARPPSFPSVMQAATNTMLG